MCFICETYALDLCMSYTSQDLISRGICDKAPIFAEFNSPSVTCGLAYHDPGGGIVADDYIIDYLKAGVRVIPIGQSRHPLFLTFLAQTLLTRRKKWIPTELIRLIIETLRDASLIF